MNYKIFALLFVGLLIFSNSYADVLINKETNQTCIDNTTLRYFVNKTINLDGNVTNELKSYDTVCEYGCTDDVCNYPTLWVKLGMIAGIVIIILVMLFLYKTL